MTVSFYKNPQMVVHELKLDHLVAFSNENFLRFFIMFYCKTDRTKQENFQNSFMINAVMTKLASGGAYRVET